MLKNVIRRLSRSISSHFGAIHFLKCVLQLEIAKKFTKTPILKLQGHSRSSTLTQVKILSLLLVMITSISVPICNRFHATQDNCAKITTF